ncbi:DUF4232 domain-containing protein [Actinocorallia libanotica]|uniref:DUF4232 domain-containing protein n=1 Tax=Actinocorallia libanotica TaxID=46162 RepID=A0ABN1QGS5_9ACTN
MRTIPLLLGLSLLVTACGEEPPRPLAIPSIDQSTGSDFEVCPESGVLVRELDTNAAMGLRAMSISLVNCGDVPQKFNGYPEIELYDAEGDPITADFRHGSGGVAQVESFEAPAAPFTLKPGELATAGILWRNLVENVTRPPVTADSMAVVPRPGMDAQRLTDLNIDLGTTVKVGLSPWKKSKDRQRTRSSAPEGT